MPRRLVSDDPRRRGGGGTIARNVHHAIILSTI